MNKFLTVILVILALVFFKILGTSFNAAPLPKSSPVDVKTVEIAGGLEFPWGMAFLPNGDILVTEREGRLRIIKDGLLQDEPVQGLPENIYVAGQGGLLDVVLHPGFSKNRLIYFSYAAEENGLAGTQVARAKFMNTHLENVEVIFKANPKTGGDNHFGSRLAFDAKGYLFITLGERYSYMKEAQNVANHLGSIIRIHDDGRIPQDNPFVGQSGARGEIYAYGVRNAQGLAMRPENGEIWYHEHGPKGGDEVNILKKGANYGWPVITYGIDYTGFKISDKTEMDGMEQPVIYWDPSIAPSGMAFYQGDKFPQWQGDLFVGALAHRHLRHLVLSGDEVIEQESLLVDSEERIRDVRIGPDGYIYVLTDSHDGKVLRLEPR